MPQRFNPPTWFTRPHHPREIEGIPKTSENYGVIHREIENSANVLFQEEKAGVIDFQECWWGYYVVEIVGLLESQESFVANHQAAFLEGYQRVRQLPFTHPGGGMVALAVDDAEAAMEELKQAGVSVYWSLEETPVCYLAIVEDPDGNRIIIHQRKDRTIG